MSNRDDISTYPITASGMCDSDETWMIVTPDGEHVATYGVGGANDEANALKFASMMNENKAGLVPPNPKRRRANELSAQLPGHHGRGA